MKSLHVFRLMCCLLLLAISPFLSAQTPDMKRAGFAQQLELYRQAVAQDKEAPLHEVTDPKVADLVSVAERAMEKLYAGKDAKPGSDLRSKARIFQQKLAELQTSDMGRWLARDEETVLVFMGLSQDTVISSEKEMGARLRRLKASTKALEDYNSKTAGPLNPKDSTAAAAILEDATWVESYLNKLDQRLLTLDEYEKQFPAREDWSSFETLGEAIRARIASDVRNRMQELAQARQKAEDEGLEEDVAAEFQNTREELTVQREGRQKLSQLSRKLLEAEYDLKAAELQTNIVERQSAAANRKLFNQQLEADNEQERVEKYLQSAEIQRLLAPFCSPGELDASTSNMGRPTPVKSREKGPMSLSRLSAMGALAPDRKGVTVLVDIASSPHNDRAHWSVSPNNWSKDEFVITDMNGNEVNRFIEAQNILINHSSTLIKLKMLNP